MTRVSGAAHVAHRQVSNDITFTALPMRHDNPSYPNGVTLAVHGNKVTVTDLADHSKQTWTKDAKYKPAVARFKGYTKFQNSNNTAAVLMKFPSPTRHVISFRFSSGEGGGSENYKAATR
jgi:hypothetical protein